MEFDFKKLGRPMNEPSKELETFPKPASVTKVLFTSDEVTSFCPVTEQPDFNTVTIEYHPDELCVESKSLKLYLWTFRDERIFGEGLAHQIAQDMYAELGGFREINSILRFVNRLKANAESRLNLPNYFPALALRPFYIKVTLVQSIRGGLQMTAVAEMSQTAIQIEAPFVHYSKTDILRKGLELGWITAVLGLVMQSKRPLVGEILSNVVDRNGNPIWATVPKEFIHWLLEADNDEHHQTIR